MTAYEMAEEIDAELDELRALKKRLVDLADEAEAYARLPGTDGVRYHSIAFALRSLLAPPIPEPLPAVHSPHD